MLSLVLLTLSLQTPLEPSPQKSPAARAVFVDGVAALVQGRVITKREVDLEARRVLSTRLGAAVLTTRVDKGLRERMLETMIVQELLAYAARKEGISVRERDIESKRKAFIEKLGSESVYARLLTANAADEDRMREMWRRDLIVKRFLEEVVFVSLKNQKIGPREAKFLEDNKEFAAGLTTEERLQKAFAQLQKESSKRLLDKVLQELRARLEVRVVSNG